MHASGREREYPLSSASQVLVLHNGIHRRYLQIADARLQVLGVHLPGVRYDVEGVVAVHLGLVDVTELLHYVAQPHVPRLSVDVLFPVQLPESLPVEAHPVVGGVDERDRAGLLLEDRLVDVGKGRVALGELPERPPALVDGDYELQDAGAEMVELRLGKQLIRELQVLDRGVHGELGCAVPFYLGSRRLGNNGVTDHGAYLPQGGHVVPAPDGIVPPNESLQKEGILERSKTNKTNKSRSI